MKGNVQRLKLATRREHAQLARIRKLMLVMPGLLICYLLVVHVYIDALHRLIVPVLGLPLGVYLPAQAALAVVAVMLLSFARKAS